MVKQAARSYTDMRYWLEYAMEHPGRALKILAGVVVGTILVIASFAIEAIPLWIAGFAMAGLTFVFGYRQAQRVMLVRSATPDHAGSLTPGPTKVSGTVTTSEAGTITPNHADDDCVAYTYEEKIKKNTGSNDGSRTRRNTDSGSVPFYIEDQTGAALVDPTAAHLDLRTDERSRGGRRKIKESYLEPGDSVTVYAECVRPRTGGGGYIVVPDGGQNPHDHDETPPRGGQPSIEDFLPEGVERPEDMPEDAELPDPEEVPPQAREMYRQMLQQAQSHSSGEHQGQSSPGQHGGGPTNPPGEPVGQENSGQHGGGPTNPPGEPVGQSTPGQGAGGPANPPGEPVNQNNVGQHGSGGTTQPGATDMMSNMAEAASSMGGEYSHLFESEDRILSPGPEYNSMVVTDKSGFSVYAKQALTTLALFATGVLLTGASLGMLLGIYSP